MVEGREDERLGVSYLSFHKDDDLGGARQGSVGEWGSETR